MRNMSERSLSPPFEAYKGQGPYVFVSYAHKDKALVYPEILRLHEAGCRTWYDEGIEPGKDFSERIGVALQHCALFLVFITPNAATSTFVRDEIYFALDQKRAFLAVYLLPTSLPTGLRLRIGALQAILKHELPETEYRRKLLAALPTEAREAAGPSPAATTSALRIELKVIEGAAAGRTFAFEEADCFLFGRAPDARVSITSDPAVSRNHFLLLIAPPHCKVQDLGSTNGTIVNSVRYGGKGGAPEGVTQAPEGVRESLLRNADVITVGRTRMKVSIPDFGPPAPSPPPASNAPADLPSETIPGYRLEQELERTGVSASFRAVHLLTRRPVLLRAILSTVGVSAGARSAFQRDIELTRGLKHRHVRRVLDCGEAAGVVYVASEWCEGVDLETFLAQRGGRLPLAEAAPLLLAAAEGLAHAHTAELKALDAAGKPFSRKGVVHRDLSPRSILLVRDGDHLVPKVCDFGLCRSLQAAGYTNITQDQQVVGAPAYWPREQITHYRLLVPASDVFSMAAIGYRILTGAYVRDGFESMFRACEAANRAPGIADYMEVIGSHKVVPLLARDRRLPQALAAVLDRALQEKEEQGDDSRVRTALANLRYPDGAALHAALAGILRPFLPQR